MKSKLVVKTFRRKVKIVGYVDPEIQRVQQLGVKVFGIFIPLDEEIVPADVDIAVGTYGANFGSDWRSKFANWIPKKNGGCA